MSGRKLKYTPDERRENHLSRYHVTQKKKIGKIRLALLEELIHHCREMGNARELDSDEQAEWIRCQDWLEGERKIEQAKNQENRRSLDEQARTPPGVLRK